MDKDTMMRPLHSVRVQGTATATEPRPNAPPGLTNVVVPIRSGVSVVSGVTWWTHFAVDDFRQSFDATSVAVLALGVDVDTVFPVDLLVAMERVRERFRRDKVSLDEPSVDLLIAEGFPLAL